MSMPSRVRLTAGRVQAFSCPTGKSQAFLWDTDAPSLQLRVTPKGRKTYACEGRLNGATIRMPIGTVADWPIERARREAHGFRLSIDSGIDPRAQKRKQAADEVAASEKVAAEAITVGEAWWRYLEEGSPKRRDSWKPRYAADMAKMAAPGGQRKLRGTGLTLPGPLAPLMPMPLADVTEDALANWFKIGCLRSKDQATRALMMFRGFLRWCSTEQALRGLVDRDAGKAPSILDNLPELKRRTDSLESAQVQSWWAGVAALPNTTASAYLRALLLTGARREEMAGLKWADVDFRWRKMTIADKVSDTRTIPLTDYLAWLLGSLRTGTGAGDQLSPFIFACDSKSGRITDCRSSHAKALDSAGIGNLTLHGLRRSFSLLGEAAGAPAGAIAQVMGHRPSATAEGYRPRSVDALRPFLQRIEDHVLSTAGIKFEPRVATSDSAQLKE